jgi:ubiquinone/menaquinone biosynthesis C-methylase UbiE
MLKDLYKDFAKRYDHFWGKFDEHDSAYVRFFDTLFKKNKICSILDCACGTGKDLHLFSSLGYEVAGSDISSSMLTQAKRNLTKFGLKIPLCKVDYRNLPEYFARRFDALICLSSSILHMSNQKQVLKALKSMYQIISDRGMLVLTQGTTDKQWKEKPRFILAVDNKNFSRLFVIDYKQKGARYNVLDIYHKGKKPELKVWSVEYPQMLLKDDYKKLLKLTGFRKVNFYGSYLFEPYNKRKSDILIVVANK